jgi:hypothetical protein
MGSMKLGERWVAELPSHCGGYLNIEERKLWYLVYYSTPIQATFEDVPWDPGPIGPLVTLGSFALSDIWFPSGQQPKYWQYLKNSTTNQDGKMHCDSPE